MEIRIPPTNRASILIHKYVYKSLYEALESEDETKILQAYSKQNDFFNAVTDIEDIDPAIFIEVFGNKFCNESDILIGIQQYTPIISFKNEINKSLFILTEDGKIINPFFCLSDYYTYKAAVSLKNEQMNICWKTNMD
jgi:hypothetical protein